MMVELGYVMECQFVVDIRCFVEVYWLGANEVVLLQEEIIWEGVVLKEDWVFLQVDGIKFLMYQVGCGGIWEDVIVFCQLLVGYIVYFNVVGVMVLSLGCQYVQAVYFWEVL